MRNDAVPPTPRDQVTESDLGERIEKLDGQPPSHIGMPSIHKTRQDVAKLFQRTIGTDPNNDDPHFLTEAMRNNARPRFLTAGSCEADRHQFGGRNTWDKQQQSA
jgi:L-lactate utilization protein LutB